MLNKSIKITGGGGQLCIDSTFSSCITCLRFFLCVLVVLIHSITKEVHFQNAMVNIELPLHLSIIYDYLKNTLTCMAVPTFFLISGYLLFIKDKKYSTLLKEKFYSLLCPYLLVTVFTILVYFVAQSIPALKNYFYQEKNIIKNWRLYNYLDAFIGLTPNEEGMYFPLAYQFWYVRNLIVLVIISPLIKFLIKKTPLFYFIFITCMPRICSKSNALFYDRYSVFSSLFYFSLGYYLIYFITPLLSFINKIKWRDFILSYIFLLILTYYPTIKGINRWEVVSFILNLFTLLLFLKASLEATKHKKLYERLKDLAKYSFFIYAFHAPLVVGTLIKLNAKMIAKGGVFTLLSALLVTFLSVTILLIAGKLTNKFFPRLFSFINGKRHFNN